MICGTCGTRGFETFQLLDRHWRSNDVKCVDAGWSRVVQLRAEGREESAARVARRLMGIKGPEMDEETKSKLRAWREEHKDEIRERARGRRALRRRTKELVTGTLLRRKR